jgi:molybdopterin-containing oxidoreductase family iron-sulfur binding subunit
MSRRNFFHLMGSAAGLAGIGAVAAGCQRYEKEEIVPLARRPEDATPGVTQEYSTAWELGGVGHALVATAFEGRPIKIDGNPEHPFASGGVVLGTKSHAGASTFAQASILHIYDVDRSTMPMAGGKGASMESFRAGLDDLRAAFTKGGRILSEATSSPTMAAVRVALAKKFPNMQWHEYEPLSWDNEREGTRLAYGRPLRPIARLAECETIVTIDCDIFVEHPAAMRYSRDFARSRRPDGTLGIGKINRLWSVESTMTNTGAMADHRLGVRSELCLPIVMALNALAGHGGQKPTSEALEEAKVERWVRVLSQELQAKSGRAVIIAGRRQPPMVHALVAALNAELKAPLDYYEVRDPDRPTHLESIQALAADLKAKKVSALVMLGGNPVYDAPVDLELGKLLADLPTLHLSEYEDETSKKCSWHVPKAHFLEAWGDVRTWDGTITIAQPLIAPLYGGLSSIELLSALIGDELGGEALVRGTHDALGYGTSWRTNLHNGFVAQYVQEPVKDLGPAKALSPALSDSQKGGTKRANGDLEVAFHFSSNTYDGRFANNPWMQETPDFLTKVTWDNYALVGPETATVLGLENDTMITVKIGERSIELPCYTMPGQARYSIGLVLGGGRTAAGHVGGREGKVPVGYDTYQVRTVAGFDFALKATVTATGKKYELADTQDHWDYRPGLRKDIGAEAIAERAPELIRETTIAAFAKDKDWKAEPAETFEFDTNEDGKGGRARGFSLFEEHTYEGHRWGMAIDLSTCTGCNSCMVACQSENNVPVVGRREVINNREMSWIRIDRYFKGSPDDPEVVHQPLGCQQCENAPCEQVCPVGATTHSEEGLNDMAYNRCIGTRYCANNCPYKVRRFNFLDWNKEFREARNKVRRLLFNPDVTVRMRGVMEKCSFCVQRIQNAKIRAKAEIRSGQRAGKVGDPLRDGEVVTACQAACPTEAIVFGDLQDPKSRVSQAHGDRRQYSLLPETYTKPRNRYLARVRNPNPDMITKQQGGAE